MPRAGGRAVLTILGLSSCQSPVLWCRVGRLRNHCHFQPMNHCRASPPLWSPAFCPVACWLTGTGRSGQLTLSLDLDFSFNTCKFFPHAVVGTDLIINISERTEEQALLLERKPPSWVPRTSVPSVTTSAAGGGAWGGTGEAPGEAPAAAPGLMPPAPWGAAPLDPRKKWGGPGLCDFRPPRPSRAHLPLHFRLIQG